MLGVRLKVKVQCFRADLCTLARMATDMARLIYQQSRQPRHTLYIVVQFSCFVEHEDATCLLEVRQEAHKLTVIDHGYGDSDLKMFMWASWGQLSPRFPHKFSINTNSKDVEKYVQSWEQNYDMDMYQEYQGGFFDITLLKGVCKKYKVSTPQGTTHRLGLLKEGTSVVATSSFPLDDVELDISREKLRSTVTGFLQMSSMYDGQQTLEGYPTGDGWPE